MAHIHLYNPRVLVLEDNAFQRKAAVAALGSIGITRVTESASAEDALQLLSRCEHRFDITICDLRLDGMDGLEFLKQAPPSQLGTILLTSALPADIYQSSLRILAQSGVRVAGCLPKPIDTTELKQMLLEPARPEGSIRGNSVSALLESTPISLHEIAKGLRERAFACFFQPKINLQSQTFAGVEALVRWSHPEFGLLQPGQFIDQVEQFGQMDELTEEVLRQSCELITSWPKDLPSLHVSVNISASSLQDVSVVSRWRQIVDSHWVMPSLITLELTETTFLADDLVLLEALTRLRIAGFGISLDDFGTGFTSLKQLRTLPVTEIKIDRSFIHDAASQSRHAIILDSIISVGKRLRIATVAEGIETQDDATYLTDLGCLVGQGYFYARPLPSEHLIEWLRKRTPAAAVP